MLVKKGMLSLCHCYTTFVSCISMSSECCLPLPPTQCHEFCGLEEPAEREGEPRAPAGAARPLKEKKKNTYITYLSEPANLFQGQQKQDIIYDHPKLQIYHQNLLIVVVTGTTQLLSLHMLLFFTYGYVVCEQKWVFLQSLCLHRDARPLIPL